MVWSYREPAAEKDGALLAQAIPKQPAAPITPAPAIILIPHRDEKDYRAWRDWWKDKLVKPPGTQWLEVRGIDVVPARISLAEQALETAAEFFFFLDDDVEGPDNILTILLSHRLAIVSGWYIAKKPKGERCISAWMKHPTEKGYMAISEQQPQRLIQVDVSGLGCCLIHRSVFEKLSKPWFYWDWRGPSEDFFFFEKIAQELNIKPVIDMEMRCRHYGTFTVDPDGTFDTCKL